MILLAIVTALIALGSFLETLPAEIGLAIAVALFGTVAAWMWATAPEEG